MKSGAILVRAQGHQDLRGADRLGHPDHAKAGQGELGLYKSAGQELDCQDARWELQGAEVQARLERQAWPNAPPYRGAEELQAGQMAVPPNGREAE